MRMIGFVPSEVHALRFSDYLLTQDVDAHIEESSNGGAWQVWVEHDDDLDKAKAELDRFLASPDDPRYGDAKTAAARIRREEERAAERRRKNYTDVRTSPTFSGLQRYATPLAMMLVAACVVLYLIGAVNQNGASKLREAMLFDITPPPVVGLDKEGYPIFQRSPGAMFTDIAGGQVWRLVTPALLHGGVFHILFNMMWLWRLGQVIEGVKGTLFFGILTLSLAVFSCSAQAAWYEVQGDWGTFVGMSGVNAGLFGYAWMKHRLQPYERIHVSDQEVGMMIGWLIICSTGFVGPIANAAHWGGLAAGIVAGAFPWAMRRLRNRG